MVEEADAQCVCMFELCDDVEIVEAVSHYNDIPSEFLTLLKRIENTGFIAGVHNPWDELRQHALLVDFHCVREYTHLSCVDDLAIEFKTEDALDAFSDEHSKSS